MIVEMLVRPVRGLMPVVLIAGWFAVSRQSAAQDAATLVRQGIRTAEKGDYQRAITDFDHAIRLDPNYALAYLNRGHVWEIRKEYNRALVDYDRAIKLDPNFAPAYYNRGNVREAKNEHERAFADFDQAIKLDPTFVAAYNGRGNAWKRKKEYDRALADFDQAIKLDPAFAVAIYNRGCIWNSKKEYDRAIADFDQAIMLAPKNAHAYTNRSIAWGSKKKYDRAIADCTQAVNLDDTNAFAYNYLAWLQATCPDQRFRNGKNALENAKRAFQLSMTAEVMDTLAAANAETGDFEKARQWEAKAIDLSTDDSKKKGYRSRLELYKQGKPYREESK